MLLSGFLLTHYTEGMRVQGVATPFRPRKRGSAPRKTPGGSIEFPATKSVLGSLRKIRCSYDNAWLLASLFREGAQRMLDVYVFSVSGPVFQVQTGDRAKSLIVAYQYGSKNEGMGSD
jgi:hypothetical protein